MNERLRRHARLIAGSLAIVVIAAVAYVVRSAAAPAPRTHTLAAVREIAPVLARVSRPPATGPASGGASRRRGHSGAAAVTPTSAGRAAVPAHALELSAALRESTGLSLAQVTSRPVCERATAGHASCAARTLVLRSSGAPVRPRIEAFPSLGRVTPARGRGRRRGHAASTPAVGAPQPDTPAYLQQAYDLTYLSQTAGAADTVAIVDAYDDPTAEADLATYRSTYQLPPCTTANGCFRKVGETGTSSLPGADPSWEQEIALDLDAVSALCPQCHVLLVEANSNSFRDLQAAMQTAAGLGANQISASWSGTSSSVPSVLRTFAGVATVAATGDYGYVGGGQDSYPAALPGVTAAGGTSLAPAGAPSARGYGESAWAWNGLTGGGSGCDLHLARPAYQPASGCSGRGYADVSADADPNTGLAVYDHGSWSLVGGTSLATPLIAAYYAVTGVAGATPQWAYRAGGNLNDVVSGSTGDCAAAIAYICNAGTGYDGPTGMGSISGSVVAGAPGIGGPSIGSSSGNTYVRSATAHDATLAGGIYRNGLDTRWWIEYGTSTAYGQQTPASDIGAGGGPVSVTGYLSQLSPGTLYHYRLVAKNSLGTTYGYDYSFATPAAAAGAPAAAFAVSPATPAPGSPVSVDGSASTPAGSISDYSWNFGDGTATVDAGAIATASHTYVQRGTYTVTLTVTSNGQTDTSTQTVTVDDPSIAAFKPSASAVPAGTAIAFNASGSSPAPGGSITDYSWNFGDGTAPVDAGAGATIGHTFATPGTYTVTLTTTDDLNVSSTATQQITVAAFTASPAIPSPGSPVTFTAVGGAGAANGTGTVYAWDFGDGTNAATNSPTITHTYNARGPYQVTLTVQNAGNASLPVNGSSLSSAALNVDSPPNAAFAPSATAALPGSAVSFDASTSSAQAGGTIADYRWDFGDGTSPVDAGTSATANHSFATPGIYAVTLTTTDDLGDSATALQQVTVDQPTAAFTMSTASAAPNAPVTFDGSSTTDPESTITHYSWDFGDSTPSVDDGSSATAIHSYGEPGTYTVKLTVTNQLGLAATTSQQVVVAPASTQTTPTPPPAPPTSMAPAPAPPASPAPPATRPAALAARLTGGHQRLARVLAHGLRLQLSVNLPASANFQVTIPMAHGSPRGANSNRKTSVVLLRSAQTLAAGGHRITLKLPRAAASRLAVAAPIVLTVRITLTRSGGAALVRTAKITLTR